MHFSSASAHHSSSAAESGGDSESSSGGGAESASQGAGSHSDQVTESHPSEGTASRSEEGADSRFYKGADSHSSEKEEKEPARLAVLHATVVDADDEQAVEPLWGACGCSFQATATTTATTAAATCFYTGTDGVQTSFGGPVRSAAPSGSVTDAPFAGTRRGRFVQEEILAAGASATSLGFWTRPYNIADVPEATVMVISYVLPFAFDASGNVTAAAVFDLRMDWLAGFLTEHTRAGTTGVILLDHRDNGTFMASRSANAASVRPAMDSGNSTVDGLVTSVYSRAGSTLTKGLSFSTGPQLINYRLVAPYWGVVEQIPAATALRRYLPVPSVTSAADALALIPTPERVSLFMYVAGILAAYVLNLIIISCSRLGEAALKGQTAQEVLVVQPVEEGGRSTEAGTGTPSPPPPPPAPEDDGQMARAASRED